MRSIFTLGRSYYLLRFFESHKGVGWNHHTVNAGQVQDNWLLSVTTVSYHRHNYGPVRI
jgi:hypothetical protein